MKKLIALLIAVIMTISLVGCAGGPELLGKYECTIDLYDTFISSFDDSAEAGSISMKDYLDKFEVKVIFEFKEDGTYTQQIDMEFMNASLDNVTAALVPWMDAVMMDVFVTQLGAYGYTIETKEDVEEILGYSWDTLYTQSYGMSAEEVAASIVEASFEDVFKENELSEGNYKAKDGKLYTSASLDEAYSETAYEIYEIDGDIVTITEGVNIEEDELLPYPVVLKKVA